MSHLHTLQIQFARAVLEEQPQAADTHIEGGGISKAARLGIYNHNVYSCVTRALELTYPVVQQLVGEKFFSYAARAFIRQFPPVSGNLEEYGREFGVFLRHFPPAATLPYLEDVATLEWCWQESANAQRAQALRPDALVGIAPEALVNITFSFHPSFRLLASPYPVLTIWEAHQEHAPSDGSIDISDGAEQIMLLRPDKAVLMARLVMPEYIFLRALSGGATLFEAFEHAARHDEHFDMQHYISKHLAAGLFTAVQAETHTKPPLKEV